MLKILADENMPFVDELFSQYGDITKKAGRSMCADDLVDVDLLLVRSITRVNEELLSKANRLSFVGTATIGVDHIDQDYLAKRKIAWTSAPGCNATAVAEYVISSLVVLCNQSGESIEDKTVAIVGAGNIGTRLAAKLDGLGINHFYCDPPRQRAGAKGDYRDMDAVAGADVITLHVPITRSGIDTTEHLIDREFLKRLAPATILINSCRGDVVDNKALREHLSSGHQLRTVIDVWQNEPNIDHQLLELVDIATPHIAGYSLEGKANGTFFLYQYWCELTKNEQRCTVDGLLPAMEFSALSIRGDIAFSIWSRLVKLVYDIRGDDQLCRSAGFSAKGFDNLRKQYKVRREFSALSIISESRLGRQKLAKLGFNVIDPQIAINNGADKVCGEN